MNMDQLRGRAKAARGSVLQLMGRLVGNSTYTRRGIAEFTLGKAVAQFGDAKEAVMRRTLAAVRGRLTVR